MHYSLARQFKSATLWWALTLFVFTCLPYAQTANHGFINLDDCTYVTDCDMVKEGFTAGGVHWAFSTLDYAAIWMPLTWLSYMLDVSLWGISPGGMHIENALFHAFDAVMLFVLLLTILMNMADQRICERRLTAIAALATLVWSLHPLRVEPVAWIASRKDVLSVFWELLALLFWVKAVIAGEVVNAAADARTPSLLVSQKSERELSTACRSAPYNLRPVLYRSVSLLFFACACLCKPTAMTFPVLAGLLEFLLTRRIRWEHYTAPFLGALGVAWLAQYAQTAGGATESLSHVPFTGRLLNAAAAFGTYCWQTIFPSHLAAVHVHKWPDLPLFLGPGLLICTVYGGGLLILFWRSGAWGLLLSEMPALVRSRLASTRAVVPPRSAAGSGDVSRALFVGLTWFFIAVAPMLGLSNFGFHSHAERFTYLPAIGFSLALAVVGASFDERWAKRLGVVLVVALGALIGLTWWQVGFWKNDKTLFTRALEVDPVRNDVAHRNLGLYYYGVEHDLPVAVSHFEKMFQTNRERNRNAQLYYIYALAESGDLARAKEVTRDLDQWKEERVNKQVRLEMTQESPTYFRVLDTFLAYAMIAHLEKDDELAQQHLEYVFRMNPKSEEAHYVKGLIAYDNHRAQEAIEHWSACTEITGFIVRPYLKKYLADLRKQ